MLLKLRNPGWPPEGAPGSPVSVLMPGHIAPEDGREQGEAGHERGGGRASQRTAAKWTALLLQLKGWTLRGSGSHESEVRR